MADTSLDTLHAHDAPDAHRGHDGGHSDREPIDFVVIHVPTNAAAKMQAAPHSRTLSRVP